LSRSAFIKDLAINGGDVSFRIVLTTPACPVKAEMESAARELVSAIPGVSSGQHYDGC
jgi:ATP-binding protein involved in chromosome partitioning